jgi:hypothetical protein
MGRGSRAWCPEGRPFDSSRPKMAVLAQGPERLLNHENEESRGSMADETIVLMCNRN